MKHFSGLSCQAVAGQVKMSTPKSAVHIVDGLIMCLNEARESFSDESRASTWCQRWLWRTTWPTRAWPACKQCSTACSQMIDSIKDGHAHVSHPMLYKVIFWSLKMSIFIITVSYFTTGDKFGGRGGGSLWLLSWTSPSLCAIFHGPRLTNKHVLGSESLLQL